MLKQMYSTSRKNIKNKIKVDYGIGDYYKFYKSRYMDDSTTESIIPKKLYEVSKREYNSIISEFNKEIKRMIVDESFDFKMPYNMGIIGLRKYKPKIEIKDGKIVRNSLPVNPRETRKLWDKSPEAKEKKIYVRYTNKHTDGYVFTLKYFRTPARFKNKTVYKLEFVRQFSRAVSERAKEKSIDAFILNND